MPRKLPIKTVSVISHLLVIGVFSLFARSVYGLTEDFYVAYLLGDGFGLGATHLLHYNYGMHPILGKLLSAFFSMTNKFNWYSFILMVAHGLSGSLIFYCLLKKSTHWFYIAAYWLLFFVFEGDTFLHVTFNDTALVLYIAATVWFLTHASLEQLNRKHSVIAVLIFIIASFFRMHVGIIVLGMSIPFILLVYNRKNSGPIALTLALAVIAVFAFHQWQEYYYKRSIPQWATEEAKRQQVYQLYNNKSLNPITDTNSRWYLPYHMARHALLVDSNLLNTGRLADMLQAVKVKGIDKQSVWEKRENGQVGGSGKNWFLVNNKIFLAMGVLLLFVLPLTRGQKRAVLFSILLLLGGCFYLIFYARLVDYAVVFGIYVILLLAMATSEPGIVLARLNNKMVIAIIFLVGLWTILHIARGSQRNAIRMQRFRNTYAKVAAAPDKLFIITSYDFPLQSYSIWDAPARYPLRNFVSNEHFLLNIQQPALQRNGISHFEDILYRRNVLFWGNETSILKSYFEQITGKTVIVSPPIKDFPPGAQVRTINIEAP